VVKHPVQKDWTPYHFYKKTLKFYCCFLTEKTLKSLCYCFNAHKATNKREKNFWLPSTWFLHLFLVVVQIRRFTMLSCWIKSWPQTLELL
jgi:hypothetical protein